ncbi:hypothetical protein Tco_1533053 [Tanacetum coccineum]
MRFIPSVSGLGAWNRGRSRILLLLVSYGNQSWPLRPGQDGRTPKEQLCGRLGELHENIEDREILFLYCCAFSVSLLLTPLCCDDIHDVTPRVSALAGCDKSILATSSAEAEYIAALGASKEAV